jgi:phthiocerol/phenolphthiocerol synthesis type-I polyketide synthase E
VNKRDKTEYSGLEVAVIGMAGRFPGARDLDQFWHNLRAGVESVRFFSSEEIQAAGVDARIASLPNYVRAGALIDDADRFDAEFFGFSPREAEIMDPQHRVFLECAWEAMEDAGYDTQRCDGLIGVYAGSGISSYLLSIYPSLRSTDPLATYYSIIGNDKDYLATRVSYKLDLSGPSIAVQSACSTSLVAVHLACQSLLNEECDMALAGAVSVLASQRWGYLYQEDSLWSRDGHVRAFDAKAGGTVFGEGVGVIMLKRLKDALADGDSVHAVIKGSAINNDGALKVAFTAPSLSAQADVITEALANAGVDPDTVGYIEAHGTGTALGDPIEIAALSRVFGADLGQKARIPIGSVKTNVGHPNTAAGMAGLLKTILTIKNKTIPPSLHYEQPNPKMDIHETPFYVNTELREWNGGTTPRRAGVSSFGMGGTNAHIVLEEAPEAVTSLESRPWQLLVLSAKSPDGLDQATRKLADHLKKEVTQEIPDVAYTLQIGRREFSHRRAIVCRDRADAITALEGNSPQRVATGFQERSDRPVVFMFPGGGAQYLNMGLDLYRSETLFRQEVDRCADLFVPHLGFDLRDFLYPGELQASRAIENAERTSNALPALFSVEYALARLWISWGINPQAMIGHSLGEYVAACLAEVLTLEDAVALVALRGRLFDRLPEGGMLAVHISEADARRLMNDRLSLAAINSQSLCVVSGARDDIDEAERRFVDQGIETRRLHIAVAAHSSVVDPILDEFSSFAETLRLSPPRVPYISNVTGTWITDSEATDPRYWVRHLRGTVRFFDGVSELLKEPGRVLLEVGPGRTLSTLAKQHADTTGKETVLPSLRHPDDLQPDLAFLLMTLGKLWLAGVHVDWSGFYSTELRRRVSLPTYPFERRRYRIEPQQPVAFEAPKPSAGKRPDLGDWFYVPVWRERAPLFEAKPAAKAEQWLLFTDRFGVGHSLQQRLLALNHKVVVVTQAEQFSKSDDGSYSIDLRQPRHYEELFGRLRSEGRTPSKIVHLWSIASSDSIQSGAESWEEHQDRGFFSLLYVAQALGNQGGSDEIKLAIVSTGLHQVTGHEQLCPETATVLGPCRVIPQEYPNIRCTSIDLCVSEAGDADRIIAELERRPSDLLVAYRGRRRWVREFEALRFDPAVGQRIHLRERGVYLITGGLGGVGLTLAGYLARVGRARLVLTSRVPFPAREEWERLLVENDEDEVCRKIRRLLAIEELGGEVLVASADVTDEEQMRAVVNQATARFGGINGAIHAAGVIPAGLAQLKTREDASRLLAPKVKGTLVLAEVFQDADLDFLVLCSSLASIVGGIGMVDHCAANAFLDAFAHRNSLATDACVTSINWDAWLEVGQAALAEPSPELKKFLERAHPSPITHPLLERCISTSDKGCVYETQFDTTRQWVLAEHKIMGTSLLPATAYLEMARAAFSTYAPNLPIVMRNVLFAAPLTVSNDETTEVRTILKREGDEFSFSIISRSRLISDSTPSWRRHVSGQISALTEGPPSMGDSTINAQSSDVNQELPSDQEHLYLGPRWKRLARNLKVTGSEAVVVLELPQEFAGDLEEYGIHPSLMDAATGVPELVGEGFYLPLAYDRIEIRGPLSRKICSRLKLVGKSPSENETIACDVVITDESGATLCEVQGFTLKRINSATALEGVARGDLRRDDLDPGIELEVDEGSLADSRSPSGFKEGILPEEGAEAFDRIISSSRLFPQVLVSVADLPGVIERAGRLTRNSVLEEIEKIQSGSAKYSRPNVSTPYVAPRSALESQLAEIWEELLGIDEVGVHDNFFDMGGHSLLATKLATRLREAFQIDLPLRTIFEAPTVADMGVVIVQRQAAQVDSDTLSRMLEEIKGLSSQELKTILASEAPMSNPGAN